MLDKTDVDTNKLQQVLITSLFIASKLEDYYPADLELLHLIEDSYTKQLEDITTLLTEYVCLFKLF